MTETGKNLLATLDGGNVIWDIGRRANGEQHADDSFVGTTVEWAVQRSTTSTSFEDRA